MEVPFEADAAARDLLHQAAQVIEVTREAVHAAYDHGVALGDKGEHRLELRALSIVTALCLGCIFTIENIFFQ
jgi:hypothetical protein